MDNNSSLISMILNFSSTYPDYFQMQKSNYNKTELGDTFETPQSIVTNDNFIYRNSRNSDNYGADLTSETTPKQIFVNNYRFHSGVSSSAASNNYYIVGVLFMLSIIGLLLYVNLYYEYCFRDTCIQMSKWRLCCCLKQFLRIRFVHHHHHHNHMNGEIAKNPDSDANVNMLINTPVQNNTTNNNNNYSEFNNQACNNSTSSQITSSLLPNERKKIESEYDEVSLTPIS